VISVDVVVVVLFWSSFFVSRFITPGVSSIVVASSFSLLFKVVSSSPACSEPAQHAPETGIFCRPAAHSFIRGFKLGVDYFVDNC
jgi:hypothetical protein